MYDLLCPKYAVETKRIEKCYNDALERYTTLEAQKANRICKNKSIKPVIQEKSEIGGEICPPCLAFFVIGINFS